MIHIGIVDDQKEARHQLQQEIARFSDEYAIAFDVQEYESASAYLSDRNHACDILYLDIDMPNMSGMELAEEIRKTNSRVLIIFCTNLQQFAINGYSVSALGFMIKPVQWYSLQMYLNRALKVLREREAQQNNPAEKKLLIKDGAVTRLVDSGTIEYIEVQQHDLLYTILDKETGRCEVIKNRGSMQEIAAALSPLGFVRCSAGFLVNMRSITAVSRMNIYIGQKVLPIGRTYKESFSDAFSKYLAKKGWENP